MVSTRLQSGCTSGPAPGASASATPPHSGSAPGVEFSIAGPSGSTSVIVSPGSLAASSPLPPPMALQTLGAASTPLAHAKALAIASTPLAALGNAKAATMTTYTYINLMQFPTELLEKILLYLDFRTISSLRLVNRRMNIVCGSILSKTFNRLQSTMLARFQAIKAKMPRRESARRQHPLACESDIVEMLHMRLALLQMSFGKHIERQHCCFFAGEILDEIYRIILYIKTTPRLARPYKVTDELFDLSTMAMEYFKEKIEPTLPEITYFGTDFIDIAGPFPSSKNDSIACGSESGGCGFESTLELSPRSPPQSNMVLRKRIHKLKQGMKRYSSQLTLMKRELKLCKVKLVDQTKTVVDYATRLDEYDKKNEETSRKFSSVLQELNKCKTELQFFRSKFPFNPDCTCSGPLVATEPPSDFSQVLSPQAMHIPPGGGSLDELLLAGPTLESADPGLQVAAVPLAGSASPRATEEETSGTSSVDAAPASSKKPGRPRSSPQAAGEATTATTLLAATGDGESGSSPGVPSRKLARRGASSAANVSANSEDSSGGSDHELATPPPATRKHHMRAAHASSAHQASPSDPCVFCTTGAVASGGAEAWGVRTKKRKSSVAAGAPGGSPGAASAWSEAKVLRGPAKVEPSVGGGACKRTRR